MKKIISIVLVTLMILACMPLSSLAAGVSATDVAKIGNTGYATLDAAVAAVKDGETIVLLKDADLSALNRNAINYTIDGQNKAYTVKTTKVVTVGNGNVTFKNLNLTISGDYEILVDTNDNGDITFDGCYVKTSDNKSINHRGKSNVTFKNTTVESYAGSRGTSCIFYMRGDKADAKEDECVWTIEDSTIINYTGSSSSFGETSIFNLNSSAGATYKFNLKGNTVIKNASKTANVTCGVTLFALANTNGAIVINADPTVQLVLAPEDVTGVSNFFYAKHTSTAVARITLNGTPKFIASPKVVAAGIEMPDIVHKDGNVRYTNKWSVDGGATSFALSTGAGSANKYNATVTEDVIFTPVNEGLTAATGAYGVRKFDGVIEYYSTVEEAKYRTRAGETFVFLNNYTMSADSSVLWQNNFFDGFIDSNRVLNYNVEGVTKADGSKVKLTINFGNYKDRQITFKNLEIQAGNQFDNTPATGGNATVTFDNCDLTVTKGFNIKEPIKFNIVSSTVTNAHDSCMFWIANYTRNKVSDINVIDSHLIYAGSGTGNDACLFQFNTDYPVNVTVTGDSVLEWRGTGASNAHIAIETRKANTGTLNLANSVVLFLNPQNDMAANSYFLGTASDMTMKVNGNPTFKVNDIAAKNGFSYYLEGSSIASASIGTLLGYSGTYTEGGESVIVPATVKAGVITKGFSAKAVYYSTKDFDMVDGASIRAENGAGIRFTTKLSATMAALADKHDIDFATLIASDLLLGEDAPTLELVASKDAAICINSTKSKWTTDGGYTLYRAAVVEIPDDASAYVTKLAGRACMTVNYADGTSATFYTKFDDNNVRSVYDVAVKLVEAGKGSAATESIIKTVNAANK